MAQELALPNLPVGRYRLSFQTVENVRLPAFAGSAWRGAFGRALKRLVCVTREPACEYCLLYRSCSFPYLFETPPDPKVGKLTKYNAAPHPYTLRPQPHREGLLRLGTEVYLDVTLFGHSNRLLPYIIHALDQAGQRGIGAGNGRLRLARVDQEDEEQGWRCLLIPGRALASWTVTDPVPPACPEVLTLVLETPLRLKRDDQLVTPETFQFSILFSHLLRRISLLTAFHTDTPLETDFAGLTRASGPIQPWDLKLHWYDWTRYSSRQKTEMQMGGLLGSVVLSGEQLAPFWPYLWLGQWTQVGKGTSMGLGGYRIILGEQ